MCLLGRIPDTDIYRDINVYSEVGSNFSCVMRGFSNF